MSLRGLALLMPLAGGLLFAQPPNIPEIKGDVFEQGPNSPLAGAEVTLTEFVAVDNDLQPRTFATVLTDSRGAFSFKPTHFGDYRLNWKKDGYVSQVGGRGIYVVVSKDFPPQSFRVDLYRPASITGRVVDEDGKPVPSYPVSQVSASDGHDPALTDAEGNFTIGDLVPGSYVLRVGPPVKGLGGLVEYTEDGFKSADRDAAVAYWPGDVGDRNAAVPLAVPPGGHTSVGTITLRKIEYYKVHVSVSVDCASGERWRYALYRTGTADQPVASAGLGCQKEFLLGHVERGSYMLALWTDRMETVQWGLAPVEITDRNEQVGLSFSPGTDVAGRFVIPDGVSPVSFETMSVLFRPETSVLDFMVADAAAEVKPDGTFLAAKLPWLRYRLNVVRLRASHYIQEIRYNRTPVKDGIVTLSPGAILEIVLDDHPATLSGTLIQGDKPPGEAIVYLIRKGFSGTLSDGSPPYLYAARVDGQGHFQLVAAPGEYDLKMADIRNPNVRLNEAPLKTVSANLKLERGEQKTIDVKLPVAP